VTWLEYQGDWLDTPDIEQQNHDARARFRHQLFDSLTTTGNFGALWLDVESEDFTSDEIFGFVDFEYAKQVPYGRLLASLNVGWSQRNESARGASVQVIDNPVQFSASGIATINQRNIQLDTIVVTDITGVIVFDEGVDYTIRAVPDRVELVRVLGGNIVDGQVVLADYIIGPEPGGETTTAFYGGGVRYTFQEGLARGLSLYVNVQRQDEDRSVDDPLLDAIAIEEDITDLRYGVEYNRWKIYLRGEFQDRDSTLSPFEAMHLEGRYTEPLGRGSVLTFSAFYDEIDNDFDDLLTQTTTLTGSWRQRFTRHLTTDLRLTWRHTEDSFDRDEEAFEQFFELNWRYRQTEIFARVRHSEIDSSADDREFATFHVGVRREF
jgi:hypothetical protein